MSATLSFCRQSLRLENGPLNRRSELVREYAEDQVLKWEDVDWQKQLITVRHEVAKQTSRKMGNRRFIPMEAALLHWLGPYRKRRCFSIHSSMARSDDELKSCASTQK